MHILVNFCMACFPVICMVILSHSACGHAENNAPTSDQLRVGFSSKFLNDVSFADAQGALELWIREFSRNSTLKMQPKPYIFDDSQSVVRAIKNKEIDFVAITATDYLKIKDKVPLEPALAPIRRGTDEGDSLVLLVRRDQGITDISQLRGKRLVVHEGFMLDASYLWLSVLLKNKHLQDRDRFFGPVKEVKKVSQTVLPVFFKQADVALVAKSSFDTMVDLNPQLGREMIAIATSGKILYGMFCFYKYLNPDIKRLVLQNAMNMHTTATGKQIFTLFQIDRVTSFKPHLLDSTAALLAQSERREGKNTVRSQKE